MQIRVLRCPACHAELKLDSELTVCYCAYCGSQLYIEEDKINVQARVRQKEMDHETDMQRQKNDHEFKMRDKAYSHEIHKMKLEKKEKYFSKLWVFSTIAVIFIIFSGLSIVRNVYRNVDNMVRENKLEKTTSEVMELIDVGEYDEAYVKAQSICWNGADSFETEQKWNAVRESLLETILSAKLEAGLMARMPFSTADFDSENYKTIIKKLKDAGFTNIKTEKIYDLKTGWIISDGEVESISIDGNKFFSQGDVIPLDAEIIVHYHTFKKNKGSK